MNYLKKLDSSQNMINGLKPFEGEMLKQIKNFYRVSLIWTSNALEGNSLTKNETKILIEDGLTVGGKPLKDLFEAVDHAKAYDYMFTLLENKELKEENILHLHKLFYQNIAGEFAGQYRDASVFITESNYPIMNTENILQEMKNLGEWITLKREDFHPVEFAALLHKRFIFIYPFVDGNGRIARLLMNTVLIQAGYLPVLIPLILKHKYISLLEKAHQDDQLFIDFIAERALESQEDFLKLLQMLLPKLHNKKSHSQ